MIEVDELACVDLAELLEPSLTRGGFAVLHLPGERVAVAVVAASDPAAVMQGP